MLANNFLRSVTLDPLSASVPTDYEAMGIEHNDGAVRDAFHHQAEALLSPTQLLLDLLARSVIRTDEEIPQDSAMRVAKRGDGNQCRKPAEILADISELVDILDPSGGFKNQSFKTRRDWSGELKAQAFCPKHQFLRIR